MIIALKIPMQEFIMDAYGEMLSLSFSKKDMSSVSGWNLSIFISLFQVYTTFSSKLFLGLSIRIASIPKDNS